MIKKITGYYGSGVWTNRDLIRARPRTRARIRSRFGAPRKRHCARGWKSRRESADPAHFVPSLGLDVVMQQVKRRQGTLQAVSAS